MQYCAQRGSRRRLVKWTATADLFPAGPQRRKRNRTDLDSGTANFDGDDAGVVRKFGAAAKSNPWPSRWVSASSSGRSIAAALVLASRSGPNSSPLGGAASNNPSVNSATRSPAVRDEMLLTVGPRFMDAAVCYLSVMAEECGLGHPALVSGGAVLNSSCATRRLGNQCSRLARTRSRPDTLQPYVPRIPRLHRDATSTQVSECLPQVFREETTAEAR